MIYAVIALLLVLVLILLLRLALIKKELRSLSNQMERFHQGLTGKKIDIALLDKDLEDLAGNINQLIDLTVQSNRDRIRNDRELRQAIANMSHDLRTPLTAIRGYIQLLEADSASIEKQQEYISIAHTTTKRLHSLLDDFFELSTVQSIDYHLKLEPLQLNSLLWEVMTSFYDQFNERQLEPKFRVTDEVVSIHGDESAVKRVLENIIGNVVKHATGEVSISLEKLSGKIVLVVCNEAHNLNEHDIGRLFDRFYTADQSRSGRRSGLGLSIAHSLMLKMNGRLTAEFNDGYLEMKCEWKQ
jgi:signal transduction histidine kinase